MPKPHRQSYQLNSELNDPVPQAGDTSSDRAARARCVGVAAKSGASPRKHDAADLGESRQIQAGSLWPLSTSGESP